MARLNLSLTLLLPRSTPLSVSLTSGYAVDEDYDEPDPIDEVPDPDDGPDEPIE